MGEEFGEADGGGFGAFDLGFAGGAEGSYAEGHGDAVVQAGVDGGSVEGLAAGDFEAVGIFREGGSHGAEVFGDEGNAVGFFDAQLLSVTQDDAVGGVRCNGAEDGELVDELGGERAGDYVWGAGCGGGVGLNLEGSNEFAVGGFDVERPDFGSEGRHDVEQGGAGGVEADGVEDQVGIGEEERRAEEEGGGAQVAGDGEVGGGEGLAAFNRKLLC